MSGHRADDLGQKYQCGDDAEDDHTPTGLDGGTIRESSRLKGVHGAQPRVIAGGLNVVELPVGDITPRAIGGILDHDPCPH